VISDGRIVGSGRHDELMRDCDIYKEMAKIQEFGEEGQ
jgi:ATP-binding cassette subfamily B protein